MITITTRNLYELTRACKTVAQLKQVLAQIIQDGIANHPLSLSSILSFSATSSQPDLCFASLIFACIEKPNSFIYNSMIRGFTNAGDHARALHFYLQMNRVEHLPDKFTFPFVLKACAVLEAVELGRSVHGKVLRMGFSLDLFIRSSLVRMYSDFDEIEAARVLFDEIVERDLVMWNSMIGGYMKCGLLERAFELFESMPCKNVATYNAMMGGYAKFGCIEKISKLFNEMPNKDLISWNTVIGAHARFGSVDTTLKLFSDTPERNLTTWSTIISGFAQGGRFGDALEVFRHMLDDGVKPNQAVLVSVLTCCAHLGALEQGRWIHGYIQKNGIEVDDILGASLIDMYSKCGFLQGSMSVFDKMEKKGVCSWTSMIYGYAIHGHPFQSLDLFGEMKSLGFRPNAITFVATLAACSHAGLVDRGRDVFSEMHRVHGIIPTIEHYTCMVDLLSRAGLLDEAQDLIKSMPMKPDIFVWGAFTGGIRIHGGGSGLVSQDVSEGLARLVPRDSGAYVLMSNMYALNNQWDDVTRIRRKMEEVGVKKNPGCSTIEVDQVVHEFLAGGRLHPQSEKIYGILDQIYREIKIQASID
ncbi:PREDICTED: pentatricopeptide repeat-containing protein At1g08070, chloroplastic-like [Nelumbo nucifera]|uniref:Pentatricopeptide repeat-containing protein At1g08070, chloroplastic-like n=2 Tax=Nelumbo nucifera TaxID=4432 RepID=A0A822YWB9_NELNU|nr:PREDICTED: pentatricopeptide repeat-containing protein At1g08070, chloroplastic-like [Nelumbo nucifera]DAD36837.1 TPA_asm: hypothetical protein HUJ06_007478 [Nelumbo nucifera]